MESKGGARHMIILVDMDGVLANFEKGILDAYRKHYPELAYIPLDERTTFHVADQYPHESKKLIYDILENPDYQFFTALEPVDGSVGALNDIRNKGHDVYICTSPISSYDNCVLQKYQWVEQHLGKDWVKRLILTKDKTIVISNILIDDRPNIKGIITPVWEHVLYTQPYNKNVTGKRRLTWRDYQAVLGI
jgi:5'-nucleotidase